MFSNRVLTLVSGVMLCLAAHAQEPGSVQADAISTVQELLRLDSDAALAIERQRLSNVSGKQPPSLPPIAAAPIAQPIMKPYSAEEHSAPEAVQEPAQPQPAAEDQVELLGIFGFGHQLRADVAINGRRVRFQAGQPAPINGPSVAGFRLIEIKTPCAVLANAQGSKTVCIKQG